MKIFIFLFIKLLIIKMNISPFSLISLFDSFSLSTESFFALAFCFFFEFICIIGLLLFSSLTLFFLVGLDDVLDLKLGASFSKFTFSKNYFFFTFFPFLFIPFWFFLSSTFFNLFTCVI